MNTDYTKIEKIKEWLKNNLTDERYEHSLGCADAAKEIAKIMNYDEDRAYLAGLIHDCAKSIPLDEAKHLLKENNFELVCGEENNKKVLHAPAGAIIAKKEFGITDEDILSAIRWHTLGKSDMNPLEKIVFIADKIEPFSRGEIEYKQKLQLLKKTGGADKIIFDCYAYTIKSLVDRKMVICPRTVEIYNDLLLNNIKN